MAGWTDTGLLPCEVLETCKPDGCNIGQGANPSGPVLPAKLSVVFVWLPGDVAFLGWSVGFVVTGFEPRILCMLGRRSPIELQWKSTSPGSF